VYKQEISYNFFLSYMFLQSTFPGHKLIQNRIHFLLLVPSFHFSKHRHDFVAGEPHGRKFTDYDVQRDIFVLDLRR
jgi:hypothetical protein